MALLNKICELIKFTINNIIYFPQAFWNMKALDVKGKDVVLFYLPRRELVTGGILSIFFLLDKSVVLRPNVMVLPVVLTKFQRYYRTSWFKSPFFIYNFLLIRNKLEGASRIVIHVPECLFDEFFERVRRYKLQNIVQRSVINILNQNSESMPSDEVFWHNKPLCGKLTMTLAFAVNQNKNYSFLDIPQITMSAWSYGDKERFSNFDSKEDICIISPDVNSLKELIIHRLESYGIKCIEIRNIPFERYRSLCLCAKWAISFGEGYDGYSMGTLKDGGIGFGVDQSNFRPAYIDVQLLPPNMFNSYQSMYDHILDRIKFFEENPIERKQISEFFIMNSRKLNSPEFVIENLKYYYKTIGF